MAVGHGSTLGAPSVIPAAASDVMAAHVEDAVLASTASGALRVMLDMSTHTKRPSALAKRNTGAAWLQHHHTHHLSSAVSAHGKPGSRRRRRYDNAHLTEHPIVVKHACEPDFLSRNDRFPGLSVPRPASPFTKLPHEMVASLPTTAAAASLASAAEHDKTVLPGELSLTRQDRRLRQQIRKYCAAQAVKSIESEILTHVLGVDASAMFPGEQVSVEDWIMIPPRPDSPVLVPAAAEVAASPASAAPPLCYEISDKFLRLTVHALCRYYRLGSRSMDESCGKRYTYIHAGRRNNTGSDHVVPVLPCTSFFEYVFA